MHFCSEKCYNLIEYSPMFVSAASTTSNLSLIYVMVQHPNTTSDYLTRDDDGMWHQWAAICVIYTDFAKLYIKLMF